MRYYETLYIVNPNYEQERLTDVIEAVAKEVKKSSVNIIDQVVWGKKRLAYRIQNHKYGTYILLKLETENPNFLIDFNMFMKLNKAIIRIQTIRLDEKPEAEKEIKSDDIIKDTVIATKKDNGLKKAALVEEEEPGAVNDVAVEDSSKPKDEEKENEQEKPAEETQVHETETATETENENPETIETEKETENPEPEPEPEPEPTPEPEEDKSADQDDNDAPKGKEEKEEK